MQQNTVTFLELFHFRSWGVHIIPGMLRWSQNHHLRPIPVVVDSDGDRGYCRNSASEGFIFVILGILIDIQYHILTMNDQSLKTYRGNCHCGIFRFEIDIPPIENVDTCNCSICFKKGYLWVSLSQRQFRVTKGGEDELTSYLFGSKTMPHKVNCLESDEVISWRQKFCPVCGTGVMLRKLQPPNEEETYVNVSCSCKAVLLRFWMIVLGPDTVGSESFSTQHQQVGAPLYSSELDIDLTSMQIWWQEYIPGLCQTIPREQDPWYG